MEEKTRNGVCYYKRTGRWRARIFVDKKEISLGYFHNEADAIEARKKAERTYEKYYARGKHPNSKRNSPYTKGHKLTGKAEANPFWKGDEVGYNGLHAWVREKLGYPSYCEHCGDKSLKSRQYNWANKSQTYKRDITDWLRLCCKCHKKYDKKK